MAAVEGTPILEVTAGSAEATQEIAARLARVLVDGDVICLFGDLGAGKTTFTRGLVGALGAPVSQVSSPTFTLLHEYAGGRLPVYHGDAYRLAGGGLDADAAGFTEVIARREGVFVLEWPERVEDALPPERLDIHFTDEDEDRRKLLFLPWGPRWDTVLTDAADWVTPC